MGAVLSAEVACRVAIEFGPGGLEHHVKIA
jgi:hypothetical protein